MPVSKRMNHTINNTQAEMSNKYWCNKQPSKYEVFALDGVFLTV